MGGYGVSQVMQTLRVNGTDLNKRRGIIGGGKHRAGSGGKTTFVELNPGLVDQALAPQDTAAWMELERPDGLRLRIQPTGGADMLALIDRFMGA